MGTHIEKLKGFDPLRWRFEASARDNSASERYVNEVSTTQGSKKIRWPGSYRFRCQRRFWQVRVVNSDGMGTLQAQLAVLEVSSCPTDRTHNKAVMDVQDGHDVATYAHFFNKEVVKRRQETLGARCTTMVKVAMPVACEVLGTSLTQHLASGDSVTLWPYPHSQVKKFVYDGSEDFCMSPQAFFHYAWFMSGGKDCICDMQGMREEDGGILLVDPCLRRSGSRASLPINKVSRPEGEASDSEDPEGGSAEENEELLQPLQEWFSTMHPQCSPMCSVFAKNRKDWESVVSRIVLSPVQVSTPSDFNGSVSGESHKNTFCGRHKCRTLTRSSLSSAKPESE